MPKRILALVLAALLGDASSGPAKPPDRPSPREQVRAIGTGSPVEVRFLDGSRQRGWITDVSETGFVLTHERNKLLQKSPVDFTRVRAVKQVKSVKPSHAARNILIGVVIAVVAIGVAIGIEIKVHGLG